MAAELDLRGLLMVGYYHYYHYCYHLYRRHCHCHRYNSRSSTGGLAPPPALPGGRCGAAAPRGRFDKRPEVGGTSWKAEERRLGVGGRRQGDGVEEGR